MRPGVLISRLRTVPARTLRLGAVLLVLLGTAGCDQATKQLARTELGQSGSLPYGVVEFTLAENPGAFLSLGASLPQEVRSTLLTVGVSLGLSLLLVYLLGSSKFGRWQFFALVLVWAGGMSNLIDRYTRHGLVTDFIVLRLGPLHTGVFNLADLAIVTGLLLLALTFAFPQKGKLQTP